MHRRPNKNKTRRTVLLSAVGVLCFSPFSLALQAAPGDSKPVLLSTTGGKGAGWANMAELKKAAEANNLTACAQYGDALLRGDGVTQDTVQAMTYLRQAADSGEANASFRLAKIYDDGDFAPRDYDEAFAYYSTAAKAGVSEAQYNLGVMYVSAHGVKRDYSEGLAWLIVATKNGASGDGEQKTRAQLIKLKKQTLIAAAEQRATAILANPAAAIAVGNPTTEVTPPKPQAPAKIDLGISAPGKITIAPPASSVPDLGKDAVGSLPPPRVPNLATQPAGPENKEPQPKKLP